MHPIFSPFLPLLFNTPLTACHLLTYAFLMLSACFHLSCTFFLVFMLVTSSIAPPLYLYCLCLFMCTLVLCLPYYSCWSLHSCLCSLHTYHSHHASWSHFTHAFTPVTLVTLFFICALIFLSSSYAIQLVHSIHALAHLINLISAHHFITVFAALSCLHTPHVHCLFMPAGPISHTSTRCMDFVEIFNIILDLSITCFSHFSGC